MSQGTLLACAVLPRRLKRVSGDSASLLVFLLVTPKAFSAVAVYNAEFAALNMELPHCGTGKLPMGGSRWLS
jgi:hypothetical protein